MRRVKVWTAVVAALLAPTCGEPVSRRRPEGSTLSPATYARVFSDLVAARVEAFPDTVDYRRRRDRILREAKIAPEELRRFAEAHAEDPDLMAAIYRAAAVRLDSLAALEREDRGAPEREPRP